MKTITIYTDGAARGNPGPAGAGYILFSDNGEVLFEGARYLGETTNNQAEYQALLGGLEKAIELGALTVNVKMDSELIVKQLRGQYRVKNEGLKPLYMKARNLIGKFEQFHVEHVRRENNKDADRLANQAIDDVL